LFCPRVAFLTCCQGLARLVSLAHSTFRALYSMTTSFVNSLFKFFSSCIFVYVVDAGDGRAGRVGARRGPAAHRSAAVGGTWGQAGSEAGVPRLLGGPHEALRARGRGHNDVLFRAFVYALLVCRNSLAYPCRPLFLEKLRCFSTIPLTSFACSSSSIPPPFPPFLFSLFLRWAASILRWWLRSWSSWRLLRPKKRCKRRPLPAWAPPRWCSRNPCSTSWWSPC